eukprot:TRINITY_DN26363_c0_g1_i1.p1 TRINITY_DN26363_c0_g1~~TRINITY_DN26363_c0_g1_i1.p1  ORF type:complete len:964 (-),score=188.66 TRINITY_DN26363_c0_g1_i1:217-2781(-)
MDLSQYQKFFNILLQQIQTARASIPKPRAEGIELEQKPTLMLQIAMLAKLLAAVPVYQLQGGALPAVGTRLEHAALDSLALGAFREMGDETWFLQDGAGAVGWDAWASSGMSFSADMLTASKGSQVTGYGGAVGPVMTEGLQHFAVRVWQPMDDAFFVGVCAPDCIPNLEPKNNAKVLLWSGGSAARPGTVRLFGEKLRQMSTFTHGDVIGVVVDFNSGAVTFFKNGQMQFCFDSACRGPLCPFFAVKHPGPAATLLCWGGPEAAPATFAESKVSEELCSSCRFVEVDGSQLEGGGQVLRVALGCSALLRVPLHIYSIRAGRSNPGLGAQHTAGAKLVADCCNGLLSPESLNCGAHCVGVTFLRLWPSVTGVRGGSFMADTRSAGATTLLLQASLPCCLMGAPGAKTHLTLKGGTNVKWSPPVDHTRMALLPLLERMGVEQGCVHIDVKQRGFHPLGGGQVMVNIEAVHRLKPLCLVERGDVAFVHALVFARGVAKAFAKDVAESLQVLLRDHAVFSAAIVKLELDVQDQEPELKPTAHAQNAAESFEEGCGPLTRKDKRAMHLQRQAALFGALGVQLVAHGNAGGVISADVLATEDFASVPRTALKALEEQWSAGGAIDEHLMDQLVIYMALADGKSSVVCNGRTSISSLHLETAAAVAAQITGVEFQVTPCTGVGGRTCLSVECTGLAWRNERRWCGNVLGLEMEKGLVLNLTCDDAWERDCMVSLPQDGVIRNEKGERCRHVTLLPMRSFTSEVRERCKTMLAEIMKLPLPIVNFHPEAATITRDTCCSVFFALQGQKHWHRQVAVIAKLLGAEAPPKERLFHMSVWNSNLGDPFRSVGSVCVEDFPHVVW